MAENTDTAVRENQPQAQRPANQPAPLPASDRDLRWKSFRAGNPRFRVFLIVGIIVLLVAGFFLWRYFDSYEDTDDAQIDGHLNSISARVSGHVLKLLVDDNQYVPMGTPLIEIDPKDYQVAVDRAKADYADAVATAEAARVNVPITSVNTNSQTSSAQADVENANAGIAAARQQFSAAKAQLAEAEANNVKAQNDLVRYKQLVDKQEISEQQYDQAVAAAHAGTASVDAARASASAADNQVRQAQSRLLQAQANLRAAATGPQQVETFRSRAQSAQAHAVYDEQVANYRNTVLSAYQEVEDNLAALRQLQQESVSEAAAVKATATALEQAQYRYKAGLVTYLEVVTAENTSLQAQLANVAIQLRRMSASVLLVKALGGSWPR